MSQQNPSQAPHDDDAPPAPQAEAKTPPSPNEGRLGPAVDPAEGKRD